jgi:hypothetical protein
MFCLREDIFKRQYHKPHKSSSSRHNENKHRRRINTRAWLFADSSAPKSSHRCGHARNLSAPLVVFILFFIALLVVRTTPAVACCLLPPYVTPVVQLPRSPDQPPPRTMMTLTAATMVKNTCAQVLRGVGRHVGTGSSRSALHTQATRQHYWSPSSLSASTRGRLASLPSGMSTTTVLPRSAAPSSFTSKLYKATICCAPETSLSDKHRHRHIAPPHQATRRLVVGEGHGIVKPGATPGSISVDLGRGVEHNVEFDLMWLRDNCPCDKCLHSITKQRLVDTMQVCSNQRGTDAL